MSETRLAAPVLQEIEAHNDTINAYKQSLEVKLRLAIIALAKVIMVNPEKPEERLSFRPSYTVSLVPTCSTHTKDRGTPRVVRCLSYDPRYESLFVRYEWENNSDRIKATHAQHALGAVGAEYLLAIYNLLFQHYCHLGDQYSPSGLIPFSEAGR